LYTRRTFGREGKGDNRWLGLIPNQGGPQDYRAPARPLCDKLKTYFEAVVIKPVRTKIYSKSISFEVYGTERTGSMDVMVEGTTVSLNRHGRLWWQGKVPVNPSWKGSVTMQIIARDRRKKTIVKKDLFVHLSPSPAYRLRIINRVRAYHKNDRCQMTIRVEDLNGDARAGMPLRIGVNQTANMWSSTLLHGRTNADGEYQLQFGPLQAGHLTVMATIDQADQDLVEPGVKIVKVSKD
jgi:hypothetical protein